MAQSVDKSLKREKNNLRKRRGMRVSNKSIFVIVAVTVKKGQTK